MTTARRWLDLDYEKAMNDLKEAMEKVAVLTEEEKLETLQEAAEMGRESLASFTPRGPGHPKYGHMVDGIFKEDEESKGQTKVGYGGDAFWSHMVNYGTVYQRAQHFIEPARATVWDSMVQSIEKNVEDMVSRNFDT